MKETTITKCARCGVRLHACAAGDLDALAAAHHAVCPGPAHHSNPYLGSQQQRALEDLAGRLPPPVYFDIPPPSQAMRAVPPSDPLDAVIDGVTLRELVRVNLLAECDNDAAMIKRAMRTPAQRAAVSAHWSAQLRAKVAASEAERKRREPSVVIGVDAEDLPWR